MNQRQPAPFIRFAFLAPNVAVTNRQSPVFTECSGRDLYAGRTLTPLVFVSIDQSRDAARRLFVETSRNNLFERTAILNVSLQDGIQHTIIRQRIRILLVRSKF